jgi:hypothetical protein
MVMQRKGMNVTSLMNMFKNNMGIDSYGNTSTSVSCSNVSLVDI